MRVAWAAVLACFFVAGIARAQDAGVASSEEDQIFGSEAPVAPDAGTSTAAPASEDTGDLESLLGESVVTTASRGGAERANAAPASVYTITGAEMKLFGIRSVDEALDYLGVGIYTMRPRDYDTGIDVGAQGIMDRDGGRRILVMVDGHVMNSQDTGQVVIHEGLGVPVEAIDHIEVMLGAGSVIYGSNAMTAVINVITKTPTDRASVYGVSSAQVAPPINEHGAWTSPDRPHEYYGLRYRAGAGLRVPFRWLGSDAAFSLHLEWQQELSNSYGVPVFAAADQDSNFQSLPGTDRWGGPAHHQMDAPSLVASLRVGDFKLSVLANYYSHGIPLNGHFSDDDSREQRLNARIDLTHSTLLVPEASLSSRLYADFSDWSERTSWTWQNFCYEGQVDGCLFRKSSRGRSAGIEQNLTVDWWLDGGFVTTIGYDLRGRDTTARPADYTYPDGSLPLTDTMPYVHQVTALGAIYLQQVVRPWSWLTINGGVRVDIDSQFGAAASPRVSVMLTPNDTTSIRLSYAQGFRAPTAYELYEADRTYRVAANTLKPETVQTGDVEWRQRIGWFELAVRGFVASYQDIITSRVLSEDEANAAIAAHQLTPLVDPTYILVYYNADRYEAWGGSLSVSAKPVTGLSMGASLMLVDAYYITPDVDNPGTSLRTPVAMLPPWMGNARISYEFAPNGAAVGLAARFAADRSPQDDPRLRGPGPQLDLRATFSAPFDPIPGLRLRLSAGCSLNPYQPYTFAGITNSPPAVAGDPSVPITPMPYFPVVTPYWGMLEVSYEVAP